LEDAPIHRKGDLEALVRLWCRPSLKEPLPSPLMGTMEFITTDAAYLNAIIEGDAFSNFAVFGPQKNIQ
jgi:hypothetical protein